MIGIRQSRLAFTEQQTPSENQITIELEALVVDDEESVLRLLGMGLRFYGIRVRAASSGEEAVAIFREHQATVDVVLTDVRMPGMEGPETLNEIRSIAPRTPVLFMTGDAGRYSTDDLIVMGGRDVLSKPFKSLEKVAGSLRKAAATA